LPEIENALITLTPKRGIFIMIFDVSRRF
jgi:hypothetical protein